MALPALVAGGAIAKTISGLMMWIAGGYAASQAAQIFLVDPKKREMEMKLAEMGAQRSIQQEAATKEALKMLLQITGGQKREAAMFGLAGTAMATEAQKEATKTSALANVASSKIGAKAQEKTALMGLLSSMLQPPSYLAAPSQDTGPRLSEVSAPPLPSSPSR